MLEFPSPIGVIFFLIEKLTVWLKNKESIFPSPIGVIFFLILGFRGCYRTINK